MVTPEPSDVVMTTPGGTRVPDGPPEECQRRELPQLGVSLRIRQQRVAWVRQLVNIHQHPELHGHGTRSRQVECHRVPVPGLGVRAEGHECGTIGRRSSDQQRLLQMEQEMREFRWHVMKSHRRSRLRTVMSMSRR